jgi:hypothetical protein
MTILETPSDTLREWHRLLTQQAKAGNSKQLALSIKIKIGAIVYALQQREETP